MINLKESRLILAKLNDIDRASIKRIMELVEQPEWEHQPELLKLIQERSQAQQQILDLISR